MCVFRRVGPRIGPTMHVVYPLGRGVGSRRGGNGSPAPGRAQSAIAARPRRASEPSATPLLTPTFNPRERDIYIRYVPFLILDAEKKRKKLQTLEVSTRIMMPATLRSVALVDAVVSSYVRRNSGV